MRYYRNTNSVELSTRRPPPPLSLFPSPPHENFSREQEHAVQQFKNWERLRQVVRDKTGDKLPKGYKEIARQAPPPPVPDDNDIFDLSMELNAISISIDDVPSELDEQGIEQVPMTAPGLDVGLLDLNMTITGY